MYREGPGLDRSAHLREAVSGVLLAKDLIAQYARVAGRVKAVGASGNVDQTSIYLGEADRVFASAWEHLDGARAHLAALGREAAGYDQARASIGGAAGQAVLDVQRREDSAYVGLGRHRVIRTDATLNTRGAYLAGQAARLLEQAMPEIDWAAELRARDVGDVDVRADPRRAVYALIAIAAALLAYLIVR